MDSVLQTELYLALLIAENIHLSVGTTGSQYEGFFSLPSSSQAVSRARFSSSNVREAATPSWEVRTLIAESD